MKKYVITLSRVFPATHCRKGEPTGFCENFRKTKLHTIRANYALWEARFKEIAEGRACLCVRQWTGKPYCSRQEEIACLTREDGIGLQRMDVVGTHIPTHPIFVDEASVSADTLAANDGLSRGDWNNWFSNYKTTEPLAVIHFTSYRYR